MRLHLGLKEGTVVHEVKFNAALDVYDFHVQGDWLRLVPEGGESPIVDVPIVDAHGD